MPAATKITQQKQARRPRIAVTLGDQAGIGPELAAKLLNNPANRQRADIVLLADNSEFQSALSDAGGLRVSATSDSAGPQNIQILDDNTASQYPCIKGDISKVNGGRCLYQLKRALKMVQSGEIDGIVFAPLNKSSLKLAGMTEEDELRWFAKQLNHEGTTSEINIAGPLWTGRVTSHIALGQVAERINQKSVSKSIDLLHKLRYVSFMYMARHSLTKYRWESGVDSPRLAVCALNPHNGENGSFGREEIDHIRPAVAAARERGIDVQGPYPCDTIFLKREHFDGIITMYHDQGQIAMKLLSFDGGVTVQGGLPMPVATPAHGTAFDIAGKNMADVTSTQNAFDIAVTMAERKISKEAILGEPYVECVSKKSGVPAVKTTVVEVLSCC
jgi:4-hydroxy-L-threonine phosphate dehydrogenase PdxA